MSTQCTLTTTLCPATLLPYPHTPQPLLNPFTHEYGDPMSIPNTGTLHTHIAHGQVFMVLSDNRWTVTVQNVTLGKEFEIPVDHFIRYWRPLGGTHE